MALHPGLTGTFLASREINKVNILARLRDINALITLFCLICFFTDQTFFFTVQSTTETSILVHLTDIGTFLRLIHTLIARRPFFRRDALFTILHLIRRAGFTFFFGYKAQVFTFRWPVNALIALFTGGCFLGGDTTQHRMMVARLTPFFIEQRQMKALLLLLTLLEAGKTSSSVNNLSRRHTFCSGDLRTFVAIPLVELVDIRTGRLRLKTLITLNPLFRTIRDDTRGIPVLITLPAFALIQKTLILTNR
jgi:hypothetical protein